MNETDYIRAARDFALACDDETPHSAQVTRLALSLFDKLAELHTLNSNGRMYLQLGAMLHDIGYCESSRGHHKHSLRLIQEAEELPFTENERNIIGSIARYHRKALPKKKHIHFSALNRKDKRTVRICGALLRIADAFDISHESTVKNIEPEITDKEVILHFTAEKEDPFIAPQVEKKKDLFEDVFRMKLSIEYLP